MNSKRETFSAFLIGGTNSGCGKTTLTLGILRALFRRGVSPAPFKCGPDYIDPLFHRQAAGKSSLNCDPFLMGEEGVRRSFVRHAAGSQAAVVEGVMGLFDGNAPGTLAGSSAEVAALLRIPVVLVVNARGLAGSIAPLVRGFSTWDPHIRIVGVVADHTGSAHHLELLQGALESAGLPPLLGALAHDEALQLPERHLGLAPLPLEESWLDRLAEMVEHSLDLDRLLELTRVELPLPEPELPAAPQPRVRLGVAQDEAFQFVYEENFALLRKHGVEIVPFSPLHEEKLPERLSGLWFGGGFPELALETLSTNLPMLEAIRAFAASGRPVYGECGGYLYLLEALTGFDGVRRPLLGLLPGEAVMGRKLASLGYRELVCCSGGLFGPAGTRLRGHEFHYSFLPAAPAEPNLFMARDLRGIERAAGSVRGNVCGSYIHLHFASNPAAAEAFARRLQA